MKVGINARFLLGERLEGVGHYTDQIVKGLVALYPQWTFHLFFDRPYQERYIYGDNVYGHVLSPPARHPMLWWYWYEKKLPSMLESLGIDVFFSPDCYLSLRSKVPTLLTCHDIAWYHLPECNRPLHLRYLRHFVPKYLARADHITCVSESTRTDIIENLLVSPEKVSVGYNASRSSFQPLSEDMQIAFRQKVSSGKPYFLYLGAMHPRKNIVRLIKAFEQFKTNDRLGYKLVLAGRMAWSATAIKKAMETSVVGQDIIHLTEIEGMIPHLVASATAMVYVSLLEGFGLPIIESMQSGRPVITSSVGAMAEIAQDAAILVNPYKEEDIAAAMSVLVHNPSEIMRLIEAGHNRNNAFNWDVTAVHLGQIINDLGMINK